MILKYCLLAFALATVLPTHAQDEVSRRARWSGDIRMRWQGDFQKHRYARNALQWAFRLNVNKPVNDQAEFGMQLMTGDPLALPVAGWVNASDFVTQKPIHVQWLFARLVPIPGVTLWGGKFTTPFFRSTELVFDNDIPHEGLAQQIRFASAETGTAWGINLAQVMINQPLPSTKDVTRSYFLGGQLVGEVNRSGTAATVALAFYAVGNADSIFVADNHTPRRVRTTNTNRPNALGNGYLSEFRYINLSARLSRSVLERPLTLNLDYAFNPAASSERHGMVAMLTYGNHRNVGGARVAVQGIMVQADAVATVFASIDYIRTNQNGGGVSLNYQPIENVELTWAAYAFEWRDPALLVKPITRNTLRTRFRFQIQMRY